MHLRIIDCQDGSKFRVGVSRDKYRFGAVIIPRKNFLGLTTDSSGSILLLSFKNGKRMHWELTRHDVYSIIDKFNALFDREMAQRV